MNGPDYDHGYLRLPHAVWREVYCRAPLTRRQIQLVSVVLRESWGWQTRDGQVYLWTRPLTPRQFAQATGLATDHLARDLRALVARGVLRERERRYQVVADPQRWSSLGVRAPKQRPSAPEPPNAGEESALSAPVLKTANKRKRNVPHAPQAQLSTTVDNSRGTPHRAASRPALDTPSLPLEARFVRVIEEFVGGLSTGEEANLRAWLRQDGVAAVWHGVAGAFGRGPDAVRLRLAACSVGKERARRSVRRRGEKETG